MPNTNAMLRKPTKPVAIQGCGPDQRHENGTLSTDDLPTIVRIEWQHSYSHQWAWITAYGIKLGELHHVGGGWYEMICERGRMKVEAACQIGDVEPIVSVWLQQVELCEGKLLDQMAEAS